MEFSGCEATPGDPEMSIVSGAGVAALLSPHAVEQRACLLGDTGQLWTVV